MRRSGPPQGGVIAPVVRPHPVLARGSVKQGGVHADGFHPPAAVTPANGGKVTAPTILRSVCLPRGGRRNAFRGNNNFICRTAGANRAGKIVSTRPVLSNQTPVTLRGRKKQKSRADKVRVWPPGPTKPPSTRRFRPVPAPAKAGEGQNLRPKGRGRATRW